MPCVSSRSLDNKIYRLIVEEEHNVVQAQVLRHRNSKPQVNMSYSVVELVIYSHEAGCHRGGELELAYYCIV